LALTWRIADEGEGDGEVGGRVEVKEAAWVRDPIWNGNPVFIQFMEVVCVYRMARAKRGMGLGECIAWRRAK
jgi:hypothetical protein